MDMLLNIKEGKSIKTICSYRCRNMNNCHRTNKNILNRFKNVTQCSSHCTSNLRTNSCLNIALNSCCHRNHHKKQTKVNWSFQTFCLFRSWSEEGLKSRSSRKYSWRELSHRPGSLRDTVLPTNLSTTRTFFVCFLRLYQRVIQMNRYCPFIKSNTSETIKQSYFITQYYEYV